MPPAIVAQRLTKVYQPASGWRRKKNGEPVTAVSNINLTVPQGELFGLLGPNGAGKTTLTKMLCTLLLPTSGAATIGGCDLADAGAIRAAVGLVVSDERSFYWRISARRNLAFFAALHGLFGREAAARVEAVLAAVDLQAAADRRFRNFSSGMRQRLAIARSLLHQPSILFLDEPSRSLDPTATRHLHEMLRQLMAEQRLTVFLITHDLAEAEALCDRVALMHEGRIQTVGRPADLRRQLKPQRRYLLKIDLPAGSGGVFSGLRAILPAIEVDEAAGEIAFWAGERDGVITAVLDHLRAHHIPIQTITAQPPSLEEVFAHFTGSRSDGDE
jgi:ABC-2 type transport system ATP-binding protein